LILAARLVVPGSLLAGCSGVQSVLDPRGPVAESIATLWWVLLLGATLIYAVTMALLFYAVFRGHGRRARLREGWLVIGGGLVIPTLTLVALLVYATEVGRRVAGLPDSGALEIEVTGHQWWWEVHYPEAGDDPAVTTANELRIPLDVPVQVTLRSGDVIHSFWVPTLAGKLDAIPGRASAIRFSADVEGRYRGQCAEFCGAQHARMAFEIVAESPQDFAAWRRSRSQDATLQPGNRRAAAGMQAFIDHDCAQCHRVRGAIAGSGEGHELTGLRGPDLTHVARRSALGGRTLPYSRENVTRWIRDHQRLKPGNRMPDFTDLPEETARSIAEFLDTLQ
jgi:cytochrome c oxidase subunit II